MTIEQMIQADNEQGLKSEIAILKAVIEGAQYPDMYDGMFGLPTQAERAKDASMKLAALLHTGD